MSYRPLSNNAYFDHSWLPKKTVHTSKSDPLRVDWLPKRVLGLKGRVGMTSAPGKCNEDGVHGAHRRSMKADLDVLVALDTQSVLTLMEPQELIQNAMGKLEAALHAHGIKWRHFPIQDLSIPTSLSKFRDVLLGVRDSLSAGHNVVVHCRGGHGRTGLAVACLVTDFGYDAETAIKIVRSARKGTIHNDAQADFVRLYANDRA
jgi:protein-tyrosine phosphatase